MKNLLISVILLISSICYGADSRKALLIFSADWCPSCKSAKNDIQNNKSVIEAMKNYDVIQLDFDRDKELVRGYNIKTIPTFIIFENGKEIDRQTGYRNSKNLIRFLQ